MAISEEFLGEVRYLTTGGRKGNRPKAVFVHGAGGYADAWRGILGFFSAIDPIATARIEELLDVLKASFTLVIVTHNMQQAARVSDYTAFFFEGKIVEFGATRQIFTNPKLKKTEDYITGRFG